MKFWKRLEQVSLFFIVTVLLSTYPRAACGKLPSLIVNRIGLKFEIIHDRSTLKVYSIKHPHHLLVTKYGAFWATSMLGYTSIEKIPGRKLVLITGIGSVEGSATFAIMNSHAHIVWAHVFTRNVLVLATHNEIIARAYGSAGVPGIVDGQIQPHDTVAYSVTTGRFLWSCYVGTPLTASGSGDLWTVHLEHVLWHLAGPAHGWWQLRRYNSHTGALLGAWRLPNQYNKHKGFYYLYKNPSPKRWVNINNYFNEYADSGNFCRGPQSFYRFKVPAYGPSSNGLAWINVGFNSRINRVYCITHGHKISMPQWYVNRDTKY